MVKLPKFFRDASLALGQSYDCPSASEVTLNDICEISHYQTATEHNKAWTVCIFRGMYCTLYYCDVLLWFPVLSRDVSKNNLHYFVGGNVYEYCATS